MRQPELGKLLTSLRNEKGLTQEELVEKCNISVRTIQRIEAGEVTPRSYTIKTILAALDHNLETIKEAFSIEEPHDFKVSKSHFQVLNVAFIVGIIYFILGFVELYIDADLEFSDNIKVSTAFYVSLKIVSFVTMLIFYAGFVISGSIFKNYLLRISAVLLIILLGIGYAFDLYSWFQPSDSEDIFWVGFSIFIGCAFVLYGIGVLRLKKQVGMNLAAVSAIFIIITGATLITVFLFVIGLFFLIPVSILQLILLYKIKEIAANHLLSIDN
ncbi:helix-turn-helix domain-containing protein [Flavobacterium sp.]|jgi:transcriptional regulator with XRE-family HTH domain|uniref:helix-turn-helix domain-containing protein n=1 Tax=Flavobacterium sp. TaxID=239 RepID=UPI0037C103F2